MTVSAAKGARGKADKLFSLIIRSRGECERCHSTAYGTFQTAHIMRRTWAWTRTDEDNAWCLCASCHATLTLDEHKHVTFAIETRGIEGYEMLRLKAQEGVGKKFDWPAEAERLARRWAEIRERAA